MVIIISLVFGLAVAGCSKQNDSVPTASSAAEIAAQPPAPAVGVAQPPATTEVNALVQDLQLQVDAYQKIYKRKPASLQQMVQEGFLSSLPPAPPGKRFSYDPDSGRVGLVP